MEKKHYFLIAGTVYFEAEEGPVSAISLNAISTSTTKNVPARMLGRAQQGLQVNLHKKIDGVPVKIRDVVITNVCHLGHMTEEEFQKAPEGTELKEVKADDQNLIN